MKMNLFIIPTYFNILNNYLENNSNIISKKKLQNRLNTIYKNLRKLNFGLLPKI